MCVCELFQVVTDSESIINSRITRESQWMVLEFLRVRAGAEHL